VSRFELARGLETIADLGAANSQWESVLHLAGAAAALRGSMGTPLWPTERARLDLTVTTARGPLSATVVEAAWMRGWTAPTHQTLALAIELVQDARESAHDEPSGEVNLQIYVPPRFFSALSTGP
jgi:hypothetical protein